MSSFTLSAPIQIAFPPSRTPTPRPTESKDGEIETRARCDTIDSISSSSSSASSSLVLQTPQTPTILGVLEQARADIYHWHDYGNPQDDGMRGTGDSSGVQFQMDEDMPPISPDPVYTVEPEARLAWETDLEQDYESAETQDNQSIKSRFRRRLQRSRESFRSLRSRDDGDTDEEPPKKGRIRTLLAKLPRTPSTGSVRSGFLEHPDSFSILEHSIASPLPTPLPSSPTVLARDYVNVPVDYFSHHRARSTSLSRSELDTFSSGKSKSKGKSRAFSPKRDPRTPSLLVQPAGVLPITAVYYNQPIMKTEVKPRINFFDEILPRELRILVLKTLLGSCPDTGRLFGDMGGRKELLRLSRVSRGWQELCLDGQLWPLVHLAPLAHCLHPATLQRILKSARPFMTSLSLRGMDALQGSELIASIGHTISLQSLPNLRHLDLRGCKNIGPTAICIIIENAPLLRNVNLKGVQDTSSEVIRTIGRRSTRLELLDVSRCWDLTLGDIIVFIQLMSDEQAETLKSLRIAGLKSYGHNAADLLPIIADRLPNLRTLDLLGCTHIFSDDLKEFARLLDSKETVSNLQHLILSGCTSLTPDAFGYLAGKVPHLLYLEIANLENVFPENDSDILGLVQLLKSVPRLNRLDLERTGHYGAINDRVMDAITPGKYADEPTTGQELVELHIGYAKSVTNEAMIRLVRACPKLKVLEADNTSASNALMKDFMRRRGDPEARLSLVDCRSITPGSYGALAPSTRAREGWTGYAALPFRYDDADPVIAGTRGELGGKPVLKTFWSWRRVGVPPGWREARNTDVSKERAEEPVEPSSGVSARRPSAGRRGSWWRGDDDFDDRGGCVVM